MNYFFIGSVMMNKWIL